MSGAISAYCLMMISIKIWLKIFLLFFYCFFNNALCEDKINVFDSKTIGL
jgi:hypothetical protein